MRYLLSVFLTAASLSLYAQDTTLSGNLLNVHYLFDGGSLLINTISNQNTSFSGVIGFMDFNNDGAADGDIHIAPFAANTEVRIIPASLSGLSTYVNYHNRQTRDELPDGFVVNPSNFSKIKGALSLWPNPTYDALRISHPTDAAMSYSVFNTSGQLIEQKSLSIEQTAVDIDCSNWSSGTYFIQLTTADGDILTEQVIKH